MKNKSIQFFSKADCLCRGCNCWRTIRWLSWTGKRRYSSISYICIRTCKWRTGICS